MQTHNKQTEYNKQCRKLMTIEDFWRFKLNRGRMRARANFVKYRVPATSGRAYIQITALRPLKSQEY